MATLYLVSTPIGNLEDITARAARVLAGVPVILAEDRRVSRTLLLHLNIGTIPEVYHDFNKERVTPRLIDRLKSGTDMALITDAGTPGIADPAYNLVRAAIDEGIRIEPIPGPVACIAALSASGLPTDRFVFENFLPNKGAARRRVLASFTEEKRTVVFYESPHRIIKVMEDMEAIFGDVWVVIAREMTKIHEEFLRGSPRQILDHFAAHPPRGEMVVLFNPRIRCEPTEEIPAGTDNAGRVIVTPDSASR
jgi:16S rRNA (cytidine1402-2'-O)-methyltransferase